MTLVSWLILKLNYTTLTYTPVFSSRQWLFRLSTIVIVNIKGRGKRLNVTKEIKACMYKIVLEW